ncbi:MAG: 23S rRNA (guanosine(2251)-2'-O)-methyltransferase RlmB [Sellimonas sp.]|uniref:23S rRNA (guanosine(2251)-2'-O)-methyltransferase RlmB n=1 Tax=Sellimonas sp. TaxID=2021466 RepID=UPI0039A3F394
MITSTSNQKVKRILKLQKKAKARAQEGVFLVEGLRMVREVPRKRVIEVYASESFLERHGDILEGLKRITEVVSDKVFEHMSDTKTPQGVLAVVKRQEYLLEEMLKEKEGKKPFLIVLDNLQDPGNLGTIVRTAEGAGVTGIILSRESVDFYQPKTIRSTMGSVYRMPVLYVEDLEETIKKMKGCGIHVYAAHLDDSRYYDEEDYTEGTAFLIGNEGNGLRGEISAAADRKIKIPMYGQVESLNAAMAAGILMYEACRQRRK